VTVCHRGGFLSFPKVRLFASLKYCHSLIAHVERCCQVLNDFKVFGVKFDGELAIDGLITNRKHFCSRTPQIFPNFLVTVSHVLVFETTYVHRWVAASHFRWHFSDMIIKKVLLFMTGTEAGCNQWVGGLPPERLGRAYVFLNKSSKALPYINRPYKPSSRFLSKYFGTEYIDPDIARNSKKSIDLALFPTHVDSSGRVHFSNSSGIKRIEERMNNVVVRPDLVVYCTGYRQDFEFLSKDYLRPSAVDTREICDSSDLSVAYIGFVRPGVGAIPPIAEQQAMLWSCLILNKVPVPSDSPHYRLLASKTARIQCSSSSSIDMPPMKPANDSWIAHRWSGSFSLYVDVSPRHGGDAVVVDRLQESWPARIVMLLLRSCLWIILSIGRSLQIG
jgi:dimethylaniline monooxygenase (N-oxide forming)